MEMDCIHLDSNKEGIQDNSVERLLCPCSSYSELVFRDPIVLPRVGDEYQVEIPPLIPERCRLQLINVPRNSESMASRYDTIVMGLPIPLLWSKAEAEGKNGNVEFENSLEMKITCTNNHAEAEVGTANTTILGHGRDIGGQLCLQQAATSDDVKVDIVQPQEFGSKLNWVHRGFSPLPGSLGLSLTDMERDGFLLGLYIFGKNFVQVKKFLEGKEMEDILSFYYGKFYRSIEYRRWVLCRKQKSRQNVHGQKMFTGWRQQELLLRLSSVISDECHNRLLEVYKTFSKEEMYFEEYVFTLKDAVGVNMLVKVIGIGKGKQDLTLEPIKPNSTTSIRSEIPVGKAWSSLSTEEIVKFLRGDFRLSKARSSDLFWEAVWPRLLARGWHSEQPKDQVFSASKHSLVFLSPGVKKFSRRRLIKGDHYFDSLSDVLNKVASEPGLLELEHEAVVGSLHNEEHGQNPQLKKDKKSVMDKQHRGYLQLRMSNGHRVLQKFTIVDTSLADGAERAKVIELRSFPLEMTCASVSSGLSSESDDDMSEDVPEEVEVINALHPSEEVSEKQTCGGSSDVVDSQLDATKPMEGHFDQTEVHVNEKQDKSDENNQFSPKINSGRSKYLIPRVKQHNLSTYKHVESSRKRNREDCQGTSRTFIVGEGGTSLEGLPQNSSSVSSLGTRSSDGSNACVISENFRREERLLKTPLSPKSVDLNTPLLSQYSLADETTRVDKTHNNDKPCLETMHRNEALKQVTSSGEQPMTNSRRQSTRNRPLTTKALEALELGAFFNTKKKRKGDDMLDFNSLSVSSRRVSRKSSAKATASNDNSSRCRTDGYNVSSTDHSASVMGSPQL